jgi:SOS-response transcriptional repressor LexA
MAIKSLSPKQERIINFVTEFLSDKGYPPTIEILLLDVG